MKTADKKIAVEIMMKHCTDNGLISMCKGNSILKAMEEYASQKQVSRGKIIKATEEAYDKWSRLENENTTYLGELIAIELSELTPEQSEGEEENGGMFIDETGFHKQQNKIDMKVLSVYESNIPLGRDKCWYCGELLFPSTRTVDHFWPKCMRGRLKVVCCSNCNKMKGRLTPLGFINLLESLKEKYPLYQPWQKKFDRMIRATQTLWERVKWSV